jgi:glycosyltransferase involved in cell wall biosynthesis
VRVLFVARGPYRLPLPPDQRRKWDAVRTELDFRVLAAGDGRDAEFRLVPHVGALDGAAFYASLPVRIARELRAFRPDAVLAQGAHETAAALAARRLAGVDAAVIADVHGDWRAPTRLYGSRLRGLLSPVADRVGESALRQADAVRTVTGYTTRLVRDLGIEPADEFPAYMDFASFRERPVAPLPDRSQALFVGVLERYKNVDGLAEAWRRAAPRVPEARLRIVGKGALAGVVERLVADFPDQTSWTSQVAQAEVAAALDESTALVLSSRSEGMGRVVIEAFCRGRAVLGSRVGGIPDLVEDGVNGLLVDPGDTNGLAEALVRLLTDRELAERLGAGAQAGAERWTISPEEFAQRLRALVERVTPAQRPRGAAV